MKKFMLFFVLLGMWSVGANANCSWMNGKNLPEEYRKYLNDPRIIWQNSRTYNDVAVKDGSSHFLLCDGIGCKYGAEVSAPANHVVGNNAVPHSQKYVCTTKGWSARTEPDNCSKFKFEGTGVVLKRGERFPATNTKNSVTMTREECETITGQKLEAGMTYHILCTEDLKLTCVSDGKANRDKPTPKPNPKPNPTQPDLETCQRNCEGNTNASECKACCYLTVVGTEPTERAIWTGKECKCIDATKEFRMDVLGQGWCEDKTGPNPNPKIQCPENATPNENNTTCVCLNPDMRFNGKKCECKDPDKIVVDGKCKLNEDKTGQLKIDIQVISERLNARINELGRSVWKDNDGNFNTARLLSDSIAGVVLGTAGGLITANVVKKNQLASGFEDIKCSVGGQDVASYGDSFTVGMK